MQPEHVAETVTTSYRDCGALSFCYGQGSVFTGLAADSDLDIVMIWEDDVPPARQRPAHSVCDASTSPTQFDLPHAALDKLRIGGWPVDIAHYHRTVFDGWLRDVHNGDGWQEPAWPLPLYAVSGFTYGIVLSDPAGHAHQALNTTRTFPTALAQRSREALRARWPAYDQELASCVRRGDGWLFHELLTRILRDTYITWFAAHHLYCPHPKRLHQWLRKFDLAPNIADLDQRLWHTATLPDRHALAAAIVHAVLKVADEQPGSRTR